MVRRRRSRKQLERDEQEERGRRLAFVGTLASGLAHEIRSPLNSIKLNLEIVQEELQGVPEAARERLEWRLKLVVDEVEGLHELLSEFLTFARPPRLEKFPTDLNELLRHVFELVRPECAIKNIEIVENFAENLFPVLVDQSQFGRGVILNLLTNAVEAIGEHGTITVSTYEDDNNVFVALEDNGGGVAPGLEEKIFELFFSTKEHGSGLGLGVAHRILHEMGGGLVLENKPGVGAKFVVSLPKAIVLPYAKEVAVEAAGNPAEKTAGKTP